ncbi:MAG: Hsp33 family molecular chaperone [Pelagibacterium sp.]|uniref:Hsp33 family molecular chaperone n=1 Tax=Pelagibacterium sp. TaxID=1967288 RepID=UPI0032F030B2
MSESSLEQFGLDRPESGDDVAVPFTLENLDSRGRVVRLGNQLDMIIARHGYPEPVARLLGEAVTLAALIGSSLKFEGRFILQSRTDGPVSLLVVDFDTPDGLRAYARYDEEALAELEAAGTTKPQDLLGKGVLALTVDQGAHMDRYQGIVALEGESLEEVAHTYFMQSEQIPTRVRLTVAEHSERGQSRPSWRAGGVLLQHLPEHGGATMPDLPGDGDFDNDDMADPDFVEDDHWTEAKALLDTLTDAELADPGLSAERLLFRLYHETGVRVFEPQPLVERCTCSAERVEQMINDFTAEDRAEMVVDGQIEVVCEFCSTHYHFNPNQF